MDSPYQSPFSKAVLTSLFIGIVACVICIVYDVIFRESTHFALSDIINVSSLIFAVNLIFFALGILYHYLVRFLGKGEWVYIGVLLAATIFFGIKAWSLHRSADPVLNMEFHELFGPIVLFLGICATVGVPYFYHNRRFQDEVI